MAVTACAGWPPQAETRWCASGSRERRPESRWDLACVLTWGRQGFLMDPMCEKEEWPTSPEGGTAVNWARKTASGTQTFSHVRVRGICDNQV